MCRYPPGHCVSKVVPHFLRISARPCPRRRATYLKAILEAPDLGRVLSGPNGLSTSFGSPMKCASQPIARRTPSVGRRPPPSPDAPRFLLGGHALVRLARLSSDAGADHSHKLPAAPFPRAYLGVGKTLDASRSWVARYHCQEVCRPFRAASWRARLRSGDRPCTGVPSTLSSTF